jgi:glycosyltransferase involved in cell wall biosynthesis
MRRTIGIETAILQRSLTGVGNYLYHLVTALVSDEQELRFRGLGLFGWHNVDRHFLDEISVLHESKRTEAASFEIRSGSKARVALRKLYHKLRPFQFSISARFQRLDLFHAFNYVPPGNPGVPVLPVVYDLSFVRMPETHPRERLTKLAPLAKVIARAEQVQTISKFSRNEIADVFGYPLERIFVAPPAASKVFRPRGPEVTALQLRKFGLEPGSYFLAVGTLEPRKNLRTLITAFAALSEREKDQFPLVIVGGAGWGDLSLPAVSDRLISSGRLRFLANVNNEELRGLYEGTRLLAFPSIYEGFGMPVVEAFACGSPVAHSADTAMDEVSGSYATRVNALDVGGWTEALNEALESNDHTDPAARQARMRKAHEFSWEASAQLVKNAYDKLLA